MSDEAARRLKIFVERAVRPVKASCWRKGRLREAMLGKARAVLEEETAAQIGDEEAALERTAARLGEPEALARQLEQAVPASDWLLRLCEGPPDASALRAGMRLTVGSAVVAVCAAVLALCVLEGVAEWPRQAAFMAIAGTVALPVYVALVALLSAWIVPALDRDWRRVAIAAAGSWLFLNAMLAGLTWQMWRAERDYADAALLVAWFSPMALLVPYALARSAAERLRRHAEWASLDIAS